jgi:hypothetical protein
MSDSSGGVKVDHRLSAFITQCLTAALWYLNRVQWSICSGTNASQSERFAYPHLDSLLWPLVGQLCWKLLQGRVLMLFMEPYYLLDHDELTHSTLVGI